MIIGIVGKKRSGKDTTAVFFVEHGFKKISFAEKLKEICSDLWGIDFKDDDNKIKHRTILQGVGEAIRQVDPCVWCNYLFRSLDQDKNYVIADVRYINEMQKIKESKGIVIRVNRPLNYLNKDKHPSETEMDKVQAIKLVDYYIDNSGTIADLDHEIGKLMDKIYNKCDLVEKKVKKSKKNG